MRIFISDDSAVVRERLATMLAELSEIEIVGQAKDAFEVIEGINNSRPDVTILDIRMRGVSGIELLHKIKRSIPMPKVIVLTDYPYPQYRQKCIEAGADYFLDKSRDFEQIKDILEQLREHSTPRIAQIMRGRLPII
jgi:DNA-binding NarL/FixJ family response regulator